MKELEKNELLAIDGGFVILCWAGWFDGKRGNTDIDFLWWNLV